MDLSSREREIYLEHSKPHGVTPKQFEKVLVAGTTQLIKAGGIVRLEGELIKSVKLIVRGNTAQVHWAGALPRWVARKVIRMQSRGIVTAIVIANATFFLSYSFSTPGAWVGEIEFLRSVDRHKNEVLLKEAEKRLELEKHANKSMHSEFLATGRYVEWAGDLLSGDRDRNELPSEEAEKRLEKQAPKSKQNEFPVTRGSVIERSIVKLALSTSDETKWCRAVSTVVAVEDIELIEWFFADMESVMKSSRDLQVRGLLERL